MAVVRILQRARRTAVLRLVAAGRPLFLAVAVERAERPARQLRAIAPISPPRTASRCRT